MRLRQKTNTLRDTTVWRVKHVRGALVRPVEFRVGSSAIQMSLAEARQLADELHDCADEAEAAARSAPWRAAAAQPPDSATTGPAGTTDTPEDCGT